MMLDQMNSEDESFTIVMMTIFIVTNATMIIIIVLFLIMNLTMVTTVLILNQT